MEQEIKDSDNDYYNDTLPHANRYCLNDSDCDTCNENNNNNNNNNIRKSNHHSDKENDKEIISQKTISQTIINRDRTPDCPCSIKYGKREMYEDSE